MANLNLGNFTAQASATSSTAKPKADLWLNIGYRVTVQVTDANGQAASERRFVSLPVGIPLDTMSRLDTNTTNEFFRAFQSARNDLLDTLIAKGKTLAHGEEFFIGSDNDGDIVLQLRRISSPAAPVQSAANPFVVALKL
jgi:hypothetical protein